MGIGSTPVEIRRSASHVLPLFQRHSVSDAWALNTYTACDIRCSYCITRAQGVSTPRRHPERMAQEVRRELAAIDDIKRIVVGCYADAYPGPEAELGVTRAALEVLVEHDLDFRLVTKGTTVARDVDLFQHPKTLIQVSVTTADAATAERIEPGAASPEDRLAIAHDLAAQGVRVVVQVSPWIPGVTDVAALLDRISPWLRVQITPLRLPAHLTRARRAFPFSQAEVNEAYQREFERVGPRVRVHWSRPPRLDGAPPYIRDNIGQVSPTDWNPAAIAPDPGSSVW